MFLLQALFEFHQIRTWQVVIGRRQRHCLLQNGASFVVGLRFHQRPTQVVQPNGARRFQCHGPTCGTDCLRLPAQSPETVTDATSKRGGFRVMRDRRLVEPQSIAEIISIKQEIPCLIDHFRELRSVRG